MKILIAWFGHETNTFSRKLTDFDLLISQGFWKEQEILSTFTDTPSYLGGMIKGAKEHGVELIPTLAVENAGPTIADDCLTYVIEQLKSYLIKHLGEYDGICLGLHGAGCSESCDDIESYTLKAVRDIVGAEMPITVTLDLHGNITREMAELATGLFGIKENPHTDYQTTGYEAMSALIKTIKGEINPNTQVVPLPLLVPITPTKHGTYKEITDYIKQYKRTHKLLDLAFFPGFPYSDSESSRASVFVTSTENGLKHADHIANYVWNKRKEFIILDKTGATEAVTKATEILANNNKGFVVVNEASDNPGCGAPGDSTHLLKAMLEANIKDSAFAYMYDPEAVQIAKKAGVGSIINLKLGGKIEHAKYHGEPLMLRDIEVITVSDGRHICTTPLMKGIPGSFGDTVCVRHKNVEIVICSVQNQTYDDRAFYVGGININEKRLLGLKSSQHFKAFYEDKAVAIVAANPKGIATSNLTLFDYQNIIRPIYPLDTDFEFLINEIK